jgi:Tfp pilus assembly protein PilN
MVEVNLLPWRVDAFAYQKRSCIRVCFFSAILALLCSYLLHEHFIKQCDQWEKKIAPLEQALQTYQAIALTPKNISKPRFFSQSENNLMKFLLSIQHANLFQICVSTLSGDHHQWKMEGKTYAVGCIQDFIHHIKKTQLFDEVRLQRIEQKENELIQFHLQLIKKSAQSEK